MTKPARYQVLPPLQEAAYQSLRADIERHGVLVPIDVDEEGEILDGHNRQAIADELGSTVRESCAPASAPMPTRSTTRCG